MLLNAFGWWKVSQISYISSLIAFGLGAIAAAAGSFGLAWSGFDRKETAAVQDGTHEAIKVA